MAIGRVPGGAIEQEKLITYQVHMSAFCGSRRQLGFSELTSMYSRLAFSNTHLKLRHYEHKYKIHYTDMKSLLAVTLHTAAV